jgi:hypothetical protein
MFSNADSRNLPALQRSCDHILHGAGLDVHDPLSTMQDLRSDIEKRFGESVFV